MKKSRRAKRMQRNNARLRKSSGLNLVSLMDIFTILVFFLMVNQSEVEVLKTDAVKIPDSYASETPNPNIVVLVSQQDILVQGRKVADVAEVLAESGSDLIQGLDQELRYLAARSSLRADQQAAVPGLPVTIMGDRDIPYALLKKIMTTCAEANFNNISLAVAQKLRKEA